MISVKEIKPSPSLRPYVECYSYGTYNTNAEPEASLQIVPNGCLELIIHLDDKHCQMMTSEHSWDMSPDYMLIGLLTRVYEVKFPHPVQVFTIRFRPEALYNLFGIQGVEMTDSYQDTNLLFGQVFKEFCHRIREEKNLNLLVQRTDKFLNNMLERSIANSDYILKAANILRHSQIPNIKELSGKVYISQRQLERRFKEVIGISPKKYLKIIRINRVMKLMEENVPMDLTSMAYHCGYYDQSHFIKDFRQITHLNPSIFRKERKDYIVLTSRKSS
ncbi:helix-turn-helix domain-containing protein [Gramella sp. MAR_2010_147]|uniref:helix-turn-helix domain-containing protein n=1 Tax=Gramella sp. MAR_2010_147 TaxID=1250205 RepID=UPI00087DD4EB|nr:helix-turn-helix domain-containing protein [Gramella sp. MAR_2010_147]SDR74611.1 Helix-turn-helix domain-containing protein [Gramella sp. MAR_2010_147]